MTFRCHYRCHAAGGRPRIVYYSYLFVLMVVISVVKSRFIAGGIYLEPEIFPRAMGFLTAGRGAEAVEMP